MSKRLSTIAAVAGLSLAPLLLGGCPSAKVHVPSPPQRAATESDVVGAWRYAGVPEEEGGPGWIITIEFMRDGIFRQTLVPPQARNLVVQTGTWRVEDAWLKMEALIVWDEGAAGHWARREQTWAIIGSARRPGALAVLGGLAADHSLDRELDRISDSECRLLTSISLPQNATPDVRSGR